VRAVTLTYRRQICRVYGDFVAQRVTLSYSTTLFFPSVGPVRMVLCGAGWFILFWLQIITSQVQSQPFHRVTSFSVTVTSICRHSTFFVLLITLLNIVHINLMLALGNVFDDLIVLHSMIFHLFLFLLAVGINSMPCIHG
jgi:hypothetical protein